ncbi:dihydroorotate dehydrogenase [Breznakiella homolactica]|uniref:Dihydroorotate dehydrogenase n=1 Tax=Breznakiella homolactica TaxID=2798577 RepID=A0A7T7XQC8_9SPIR|nr:dihydroorotate dehydrogenase [Breznakiella homolactica]QQO10560.1 dihydroorotate dehydrogenase [Breznakiella homolactica]
MSDLLKTDFAGIPFKNPVVLASGTCGFGREYNEIFNLEKLGGISSKGLTLRARAGNEGIRIWETASGIMNSVGLENPGVRGFIQNELDWINSLDLVNIVNLGGHSIEDYIEGTELLNEVRFDILELNISCPNVKAGGMNFGVKTEFAREVVRKIRSVCRHTLVVKLSPNAEDIVALARACEEEGADGISLINTFLAMAIDINKRKPVFENTYAGLSGPAIRPIALRMVNQVAKAVTIPVMGMGGITSWQDALEFIMAGAAVIQVGTGSFMDPKAAPAIADGLESWAASQGLGSIGEVRGIV